jgi:tetratricopeptide (TPR) repeat protein
VKIEGDGFLATFTNAHTMVECGVALQQEFCRRGWQVRLGGHVGEVYPTELGDIVGADVNRAVRIQSGADAAGAQFLVSDAVRAIVRNRLSQVRFEPHAPIVAKGVPEALVVFEVLPATGQTAGARVSAADHSTLGAVPTTAISAAVRSATPVRTFVGRSREMQALQADLDDMLGGRGRLVMLVGEPGIGKTRTAAELGARAHQAGAVVLWGGCYDGEWAPPFGPFVEAIAAYARQAAPDALRADLGFGAAPIARVVAAVRERLPDVPEPASLQPDEERFRLLDAVSQFLVATAARVPVVLVLDDLHWADKGSIAMLRHAARHAAPHRLLMIGTYRDVDIDAPHPLGEAIGALYRETTCERIRLSGLDGSEVAQLVGQSEVPQEMRETVTEAICSVTHGNPFFVRELLRHMVEEGASADPTPRVSGQIGIPDSVRQVLAARVRRLSAETGRLLTVAAACGGPFRLDVAARVAALDDVTAVDAIEQALRTQLVRPADRGERYDFSHALIRETLYTELSPSRQVRLHRQLAEAMEQLHGGRVAEHASEIAQQYYRSRSLPGAAAGVSHALVAADQAGAAYAHDEVAIFLRIALALLPQDDPRRPRLCGRLGLALSWSLSLDEAETVAIEAAQAIADTEGNDAAADYVAEAMVAIAEGGFGRAFTLAQRGLEYVGARRDATWASLKAMDLIRQEAEDPDSIGIPIYTAEHEEVTRVFDEVDPVPAHAGHFVMFAAGRILNDPTRQQIEAEGMWDAFGEYRRNTPRVRKHAAICEEQGRIGQAASCWAHLFWLHTALGEFAQARDARHRAAALAARIPGASIPTAQIILAEDQWRMAVDEDWDKPMAHLGPGLGQGPVLAWYRAAVQAAIARTLARMGRAERALVPLAFVIPAIEKAMVWADNYVKIICDAAETLWLTRRTDHIEPIDCNLREKVIAANVHHCMTDGRLALARLCALRGRADEAVDWFAKARMVLDEQGARPLRAIVDYDEGLMYMRRGGSGDRERARPLLDSALRQFRAIGMPGWIRRAESLLRDGKEWQPHD